MIAVIAAVYLTAYLHSQRRVVFGILFAVAGIALAVATGILAEEGWRWSYYGWGHDWGFVPPHRCASALARSCCSRWCLRGLWTSVASCPPE